MGEAKEADWVPQQAVEAKEAGGVSVVEGAAAGWAAAVAAGGAMAGSEETEVRAAELGEKGSL